jgi:hypothetical protein
MDSSYDLIIIKSMSMIQPLLYQKSSRQRYCQATCSVDDVCQRGVCVYGWKKFTLEVEQFKMNGSTQT